MATNTIDLNTWLAPCGVDDCPHDNHPHNNIRLVHHVAKRWVNLLDGRNDLTYDDLVQTALLNVTKVWDAYDPTYVGQKGLTAKLSSYVANHIEWGMYRLKETLEKYTPESEVNRWAFSLDAPLLVANGDSETLTLGSMLSAETFEEQVDEYFMRGERLRKAQAFLSRLPSDRYREIYIDYHGNNMSQMDIAEKQGISRQRVHQILNLVEKYKDPAYGQRQTSERIVQGKQTVVPGICVHGHKIAGYNNGGGYCRACASARDWAKGKNLSTQQIARRADTFYKKFQAKDAR